MRTVDLDLADQLARRLFRLVRTLERAKAQIAAQRDDGVERASFGLLIELVDQGPRRATALADAVYADTSTVSRQVGQLVARGLVERTPDPEDGRASLLAATERGVAKVVDGRARRNRFFATIMQDWDPDDAARLVGLLDRFTEDFENNRPLLLAAALEGDQSA